MHDLDHAFLSEAERFHPGRRPFPNAGLLERHEPLGGDEGTQGGEYENREDEGDASTPPLPGAHGQPWQRGLLRSAACATTLSSW